VGNKAQYEGCVLAYVNESKHLNVISVNNKILTVIKLIKFNLLYCNFVLHGSLVPPTQVRNYSLVTIA